MVDPQILTAIAAVLAAIASALGAVRSFLNAQVQKEHAVQLLVIKAEMNSRLTQLLKTSGESNFAAGVEQERSDQRNLTKPKRKPRGKTPGG